MITLKTPGASLYRDLMHLETEPSFRHLREWFEQSLQEATEFLIQIDEKSEQMFRQQGVCRVLRTFLKELDQAETNLKHIDAQKRRE